MLSKPTWATGLIIYALLIALLTIFKVGGDAYLSVTSNIIMILSGFIAIVVGLYFYFKKSTGENEKTTILWMTIAMALWLLGDLLWTFVYGEAVISVADIFYLAAYPVFFVGVFLGLRSHSPEFFQKSSMRWLLFALGIALVIAYLFINPVAWEADVSLLENIVTVGYVIFDIFLLLLIGIMLLLAISGKFSSIWLIVGLGALLYMIGDIHYALTYETYESGTLFDLTWYYGNLLWAYSFVLLGIGKKKQ